jgi:hypothetical protein
MAEFVSLLNAQLEGRYRVEAEVGRGGMATVFLARDLRHDRRVALKVLLPELAAVVGAGRFLREIQIESQLRHPHILPLLDSGEVDGIPFYTMPFVEGESLADRLRRQKQLPVEEVIRIGIQVADALNHAHGKGVIHRDVKPGNIMLDGDHALVSDFGVALATGKVPEVRLTASGVSPGSPIYMSPEQAAGEGDLDVRSDLYSLGCVLYEALTGDPPFTARLPQAILAKKLSEKPASVRVVRDAIPDGLEEVVMKALSRSAADRFQTAGAMREALEAVADGRPLPSRGLAAEPPVPELARPRGSAHGANLIGWGTGAVALLTGVGFLTNRVYEVRLGIPPEYGTPLLRLPVLGMKALVPHAFWAIVVLIAWLAVVQVVRLGGWLLHRSPRLGRTVDSVEWSITGAWREGWTRARSTTIGDLFFLVAVLTGVLCIVPFRTLLSDLVTTTGTQSLVDSDRYQRFTLALTALIMALALSWHTVFRYVRRRSGIPPRVALSRWGAVAWIVALLLVATLPWRVMNDNFHERALLDGERAYIVGETDAEVLLFRPELGMATRHPKGPDLPLTRLGVTGFAFEDVESFSGQNPPG